MKPPLDGRDHKAWLEYWGTQLVGAIANAVAPAEESTADYRLNYAVNCAKIAHRRALKVKPALKGDSNGLRIR